MIIKNLQLDGFRNYSGITAEFLDGINVIVGRNAQGKTNLIEAVYYLAAARSFRTSSDKDLITLGRDGASIKSLIVSAGREQTLEARLFHGKRRELIANGVKLKKTSELTGRLSAVVFGPDDLDMIKDGAAIRRKLMDQCLSQLRPGYLAALMEYGRLYENKSRILRDYREKPYLLDLLDDFNIRLAEESARLIYYRSAFSLALARRASEIHKEFSGGAESLEIRYKTVGSMDPRGKKPEELLPELLRHQGEHRGAELKSGLCLSGAHKDDLEIDISGAPARKFASQGQVRTASVSIKLAEREIHYDDKGEYPVLLLDDVLSELDSGRQSFILDMITEGQVMITCCDDNAASAAGQPVIRVEGGKLCTCI